MNRPQRMDHESTPVAAVEHKVLPTRVAEEMYRPRSDARTDTDWILACMGSFVKNPVAAAGKQPLQHRPPFVLWTNPFPVNLNDRNKKHHANNDNREWAAIDWISSIPVNIQSISTLSLCMGRDPKICIDRLAEPFLCPQNLSTEGNIKKTD